jgi:hypothetical protein
MGQDLDEAAEAATGRIPSPGDNLGFWDYVGIAGAVFGGSLAVGVGLMSSQRVRNSVSQTFGISLSNSDGNGFTVTG